MGHLRAELEQQVAAIGQSLHPAFAHGLGSG